MAQELLLLLIAAGIGLAMALGVLNWLASRSGTHQL